MSKNKRVRNGFIFHTDFGGKPIYLRESVYLYMKNGDGRFLLTDYDESISYLTESRTDNTSKEMDRSEVIRMEPDGIVPVKVRLGEYGYA